MAFFVVGQLVLSGPLMLLSCFWASDCVMQELALQHSLGHRFDLARTCKKSNHSVCLSQIGLLIINHNVISLGWTLFATNKVYDPNLFYQTDISQHKRAFLCTLSLIPSALSYKQHPYVIQLNIIVLRFKKRSRVAKTFLCLRGAR